MPAAQVSDRTKHNMPAVKSFAVTGRVFLFNPFHPAFFRNILGIFSLKISTRSFHHEDEEYKTITRQTILFVF
jgi:hypothetical protein